MLDYLKSFLRDHLGMPAWLVLAIGGGLAHVAVNVLLKKQVTSAWGLLAPLIIGVTLESYEIWVQYRDVGLFAPGNDPIIAILGRHALDMLSLLAVPLLLVVVGAVTAR